MEHKGSEVVKNNVLGLRSHFIEFFPFSLLAFSFYCVWCWNSFRFREFNISLKKTDVFNFEV